MLYPSYKWQGVATSFELVRLILLKINRLINSLLYILAHNCDLWLNCLLGPPSVGCGHKVVLSKNMSYGRTCLSGSYAFQDDMCYDSICVEGGHALL